MKLCIPTLCNYDGVETLIRSAEAGSVKPTGYVIVDNGGNFNGRRARDLTAANVEVVTRPANLGVAASWNHFLAHHGQQPIVISNDDIILGPGAFEQLYGYALLGVRRAGFGWALFMQSPECTEKVGFYDENFWPGYYEDIDYIIRMRRAGVPDVRLEGQIDIQHTGWTTVHKLGDPEWLADGREKNRSYLIAKWGTDDHGVPYAEPFNGKPPIGWDLRKRLSALPLRWDLVNAIAKKIGAQRYLELGLADGSCIRRIEVAERVGVDMAPPPPAPGAEVHTLSTDEFFRTYTGEKFDLVFVDADHAWEQALRDVENAIRWLNPGGVVVMHDCSPFSEDMQVVPHNGSHLWTGDVWKAVVRLRWEGQHAVRVIDSNYGLGIVIPGGQAHHLARRPYKPEIITYPELVREREDLLGLVSGWEWEAWFDAAYAPAARRPRMLQELRLPAGKAFEREVTGVGEYYAGGHPWHTMGGGGSGGTSKTVGMGEGGFAQADDDTRIGDGEETFADIIVEKALRREADADPKRDTLAVVFSVLPRADTTGAHLLKAFQAIGIKVVHHDPLFRNERGALHPRLYDVEHERLKAVLCIDDDHGWPVPETPGIRRYYWCIDSYRMDDELYLGGTRRQRLRRFDQTFFVQQKEAQEFGGAWLPLGVDTALYRYEPSTFHQDYDFCFIGNHNIARAGFLERLRQEFPRSFVGTAYGEDANRIYNQSLIAVNHSAGNDINMRMFEGSATSALLLANRVNNGESELLPHVPLFDSYEECVAMMRGFIRNPGVRAVLSQVQAASMEAHTYEARARALLAAINWSG